MPLTYEPKIVNHENPHSADHGEVPVQQDSLGSP